MFTSTLLYSGLLPAAFAALVTFVAIRSHLPPAAQWASGATAGVVAGLLGLKGRAGLAVAVRSVVLPNEAADWVPLILLLAWGTAMLALAVPLAKRTYVRFGAVLLTVATPLRLLSGHARLAREWSVPEKLACLMILTALLGVTWRLLAANGEARQSAVKLSLLVATAFASALVLTFAAHVFVYGEACGALAAALVGTAAARRISIAVSPSATDPHWSSGLAGAAAPLTFTLGSYLILGHFFADLTAFGATLFGAALAAAGGTLPVALRRQPLWQQTAARSVIWSILLCFALVFSLG